MKALIIPPVSQPSDSKSRRSYWCSVFPAASFLFLIIFAVYAFIAPDYKEKLSRWEIADTFQNFKFSDCKNRCRPPGSESLPEGIVSKTSNFQMRPLWGFPKNEDNSSINLLAVAVGIKQRDLVNKMVKKFLSSNFSVMLFHYDGIVDEWRDFEWNDRVIHVSARNQTKWWFAKRFLHPDIVAACNYIFLWDEDLGVENLNPKRYVSIVKSEGLHISQPALDYKSLVHQQITVRASKSGVHRRTYKPGLCDANSTAPPCTGWVEMMAPVFSRAAWRCVWYMIQNDLIHAWGLDYLLGYCSQGDRTKNIGIVDAEYIAHYGHPTLGGVVENQVPSRSQKTDPRLEVRRQSLIELKVFQKRWKEAVEEDQCWMDPYKEAAKESS
ncbi:Tyrosine protein-kinase [Salix suchowensis]|nr:Tyrosine protein-kinase [Salix suchowensis]